MNCYHCETELIWGGDNTFEDMDLDGEGIVTNLSCPKCEAHIEVYKQYTEEEFKKIFKCEICGKDTLGVGYDYLVNTNHLQCELDRQKEIEEKSKKAKKKSKDKK
tara:strand:- start:902 stop:1216 length:315 start_codon:yes stop_codon:yes gene_type:complete